MRNPLSIFAKIGSAAPKKNRFDYQPLPGIDLGAYSKDQKKPLSSEKLPYSYLGNNSALDNYLFAGNKNPYGNPRSLFTKEDKAVERLVNKLPPGAFGGSKKKVGFGRGLSDAKARLRSKYPRLYGLIDDKALTGRVPFTDNDWRFRLGKIKGPFGGKAYGLQLGLDF